MLYVLFVVPNWPRPTIALDPHLVPQTSDERSPRGRLALSKCTKNAWNAIKVGFT